MDGQELEDLEVILMKNDSMILNGVNGYSHTKIRWLHTHHLKFLINHTNDFVPPVQIGSISVWKRLILQN